MASIFQDHYAPRRRFSISDSLGICIAALIEARQRQAEARLAGYLRGLPDHLIRKLGLPPADMEKLRRGDEHPPGFYGRVSVVSVLRNCRR